MTNRTLVHSVLSIVTAIASVLLVSTLLAPAAGHAASVPFQDPNVQGGIGFCDAHGHPLHGGSTLSHPFIAAAGSSLAAPAGYGAKAGAKATLYAFQPRRDVDPGQWSGYQLTGSSLYADDSHPLVAGTNIDPSLQDFVSAFPAKWDGLVQLRIYYTAPNKVASRRSYPAAVLRVQGRQWSLVQGADLSCDLTKVVSNEKLLLPASAFDPAHPAVTDAPSLTAPTPVAAEAARRGHPSPAAASGRSPGATASSPAPLSEAALAAASKPATGSSPWAAIGLAVLGIGGLAAAVGWRFRRRIRA